MGGIFSGEIIAELPEDATRHTAELLGQTAGERQEESGSSLPSRSQPELSYRKLWCCLNLPREDIGWHGLHVPIQVNSLQPT
ncbi:unnamed protein product, partial [Symbiodinium natans]